MVFPSPFSNRHFTSEYFGEAGKITDDNGVLHIRVKGELTNWELAFQVLTEIPSYP
jgi:hypothetical protein